MRLFVLLSFCLVCLLASGQRKQKPKVEFDPAWLTNNQWALTFSPLAVIQLDYTFMMGAEYRLNPRLRLVADAGYIFASSISEGERDGIGATGFIIRPALKWFVDSKSTFYVQPQFFYKQVNRPVTTWVGQNPVNGVPTFQQLQDGNFRREVRGFNAVGGFMEPLTRTRKNLFVDVYFGIGIRWKTSGVVGQPRTVNVRRGTAWDVSNGTLPSLPLGVRFVYLF